LFVAGREKPIFAPRAINLLARGVAWGLSKALWRIRWHGTENIPDKDSTAYIVASNHQTYLDPAWIATPIDQKLSFMAFDTAFDWKLIGPMIRLLGAFPVSTEGQGVLGSMKNALRVLKDGAALVVFPEGAREFADGKMLGFKNGVARLAIQARVPILPVTVSGGNRVWPRNQKWPRPFRRIDVRYHPLIYPPGDELRDGDVYLTKLVKQTIETALEP
jgi:1-acyl-sn-glycerol-3-phosphate acyltransferase